MSNPDIVFSVNAMVGIGLGGAVYVIYYILHMAHQEMLDASHDTTQQEELLQLSLFGDKPCG